MTALGLEIWSEGLSALLVLGSLIYQGFIALLQGQLARVQQISQKMIEIAEVRNNPRDRLRVKALASLIRTTTGQYKAVDLQIFEAREGGVLNIGLIGIVLTAYGQGNNHVALTMIVQAWSVPITMRWLKAM